MSAVIILTLIASFILRLIAAALRGAFTTEGEKSK
jgi:hypothetical protein